MGGRRAGDTAGSKAGAEVDDLKGAQPPSDILEALAAAINERRRQLRADLVPHRARNPDAARLRQRLQTGGQVDAIAQQILAIDDHIPEMHADAEPHLLARGALRILLRDRLLNLQCAFDGIDRARKIGKHAVAGRREDAAPMFADQPVDNCPRSTQRPQCADLVQLHQVAIANDVRRKNRGELSFDHLAFCHPRASLRHRYRVRRLL